MKERAIAWAGLTLALASACADVTEAVSTSATIGGSASSSGEGTGVDDDPSTTDGVGATDGSVGGSDASTDAGDTVANETSGPDAGTSGGTSGASTSFSGGSSDDGGTTAATVDPCDANLADTACDTCVKMACCPQIQTCFLDMGCACVMACLGDGYGLLACFAACGLVDPPPGSAELGACAGDSCGPTCGA